jgi:hypothetical protein
VEETIAELYSDPFSDVSDLESSDAETADSSLPITSVQKKSQSLSGDGSDSEISKQSDIETVDGWCTSDKTPNLKPFLRNQSVNVAIVTLQT